MPTRQRAHVVADAIQVIPERPYLRPRIVHVFPPCRRPPRDIARQVETLYGENDGRLGLVPKDAVLRREPLQLDQEDGWQARDGECLAGPAARLAARAVPAR